MAQEWTESHELNFKDGKQDGLETWWDENGQKQEEGTYKGGKEISSKCWDEDGNECECDLFGLGCK